MAVVWVLGLWYSRQTYSRDLNAQSTYPVLILQALYTQAWQFGDDRSMKTSPSRPQQTIPFTPFTLVFALAALLSAATPAQACGSYLGDIDLKKLAEQAVSENSAEAAPAITALRTRGAAGLAAFFGVHQEEIQRHVAVPPGVSLAMTNRTIDARWERLSKALDTISGQRDCAVSHLFWHTDLEEAKAAARASGKPILSLRLLGRLDEELSCANSRFFRTALYANEEVSSVLREHFVMHWESVRPVPKITIDFGDGRKLERTITGNSIHYVLDADGRPVDALPGLYGPKAFLRGLLRAEATAKQFAALATKEREDFLRSYHQERLAAIKAEWNNDLAKVGRSSVTTSSLPSATPSANNPPVAQAAAQITKGKRQVELPVLEAIGTAKPGIAKPGEPEGGMDDATWAKIAALHFEDARLDPASRTLMAQKHPDAFAAGRRAFSKSIVEDPLMRAVRQFERSMSEDTVRNEYLFHTKIHEWFAQELPQARDVAMLNDRVYAELFLTPKSDPWLGLKPSDAYSALDHDGVVTQ
jgi:hypothetical protein